MVHPKRPIPGIWLARGKHPQPHCSTNVKPSAYKPPACKPAEESDAGLAEVGLAEAGLSTSDTEVLGNLPKDQPGLGETTYETSAGELLLPA